MKLEDFDENEFKYAVNEWLNNVSLKKQGVKSKPVEKEQNVNSFVDRLQYLAKSKRYSEQSMRTEILGILDEVLIEVSACDKTAFLNKLTDALMCKLGDVLLSETKTINSACNVSNESHAYLHRNQVTEKGTKDFVVKEVTEGLQTQKVPNSGLKQTIVDLVDILKDSVKNNIGLEEIATTLHNTTNKSAAEKAFPQQTEKSRKKVTKRHATNFSTQPLTVFMVQNLSRNYISKTSGTKMSQNSIVSVMDRDIKENLMRYKTQLAQQIDQWLSDLAMLKAEDRDFRQAVVLDLASDIVERQKYLEFNKNITSDIDELEHLKYLIFKWVKRCAGGENMETVHHAVELMEMIRNIPVPMLSRSRDLLKKSSSYICCKKAHCEPGTSTDTSKDSVHNSRSDSGIHNGRESLSSAPSYIVIDSVSLLKNKKNDTRKQKDPKSPPVNQSNKPNLSRTITNNNSDFPKYSIENQENSQETKDELKIKRTYTHILNSFNARKINTENVIYNSVGPSNSIYKEEHSSQDSFVSSRSQDDLHKSYSGIRCKDRISVPGISISITKDDVNTSKVNVTRKKHQNDSLLTSYIIHKITNNKHNKRDKLREEIDKEDIPSRRNSSKSEKKFNKTQDSSNASKVFVSCDSVNEAQNKNDGAKNINPEPGPSGLVTPVPPHSGKPSSAAAQLMAEWRPQPVFTPPPPGQPLLERVHEEFKEYLKNWCQQIPIPANTCDEIEVAGKSRLGILNGIWKMITKLKTQPAVFQNKFYYEDVLGKEIDGLLDCLPESPELQEKKYALKSQLLDKISDMNDLIKEIETPDNYKEMVAQKAELLKEQKLRKIVRLDREPPTKIFEEMLKYCTLHDYLTQKDYKETNKMIEKAYQNKLLKAIQASMDDFKKAHGKEMEQLYGVYKESDIFQKLNKVPLPTEDEIKENADEILLGLEIEQWMKDLPIIKNDDSNEQRQRERLRDSLTKKIHEMRKRVNISDCCGDTQVRHEISYFLDMVPLEKDQDLNINKMVDELTNRLKNRHGPAGKRKSVAFQDGSRLLNRSDYTFGSPASDIYSPEDKWAFKGDEDAQYKSLFQNPPLCSTRIEQPGEWDLDDDQDAQYRAMFKDGVPCSSMIEPQAGYGRGSPMPPDFRHSYDQAQHSDPPPWQFNDSARGGSFGYSRRGSEERYQYPDEMGYPMPPRPGTQSPGFYESAAAMPNVPPDSQFQSLLGSSMSGAARQAPRMTGQFNQSRGVGWMPPEEASGFVSMQDYGPPQMLPPRQSFPREPPAFSRRSQIDPNISQAKRSAAQGFIPMTSYGHREPQGFMSMPSQPGEIQPSFHSFPPNEFMQPQPAAFIPDNSRSSRRSKIGSNIDPSMRQGLLEDSVETDHSMRQGGPFDVSIQIHEAPRPHQQQQVDGPNPFVSIVSQQRPNESLGNRNRSVRQPTQNQPSIRMSPARDRTDLDEIQAAQSMSAHHLSHIRAGLQVPSGQPSRHTPTDRMTEAASREPSSSQRARLAPNAPSPEISNQPAFYSTPIQRSNPPPHNIRERRQMEKERVPARRLDMDAEEADEGEERCHCRQRFKQWKGHNCQTCDDCLQERFYFYPYPYPYMYPPFGRQRPPYPPHCRR
ncbi:uncharacterized protein LOC134658987 [Cydia amplana]|uniref:uncharacterized protein LOC134658987 n=1 Tax=Cydia amplana TaxID=1869771 RepID=UPI002FE693CB